LGPAQGNVNVPADQRIMLVVSLTLDHRDAAKLRAQDPDTYRFVVTNRVSTDPYDLSGLSALEPNDLHTLIVEGMGSTVDSDRRVLEHISHLTGLRVLGLHNTGVTDKGMEQISALRGLQAVEFSQERFVKNQGLAFLKDLPALEYLDLDTGATDAGLKHVAQLAHLRALSIRTGRIWGPGLSELAHAPCLERLCLSGEARFTDRQVACLEGLTRLKSLTLHGGNCRLTDASLASIAKLENLEELYFIRMAPRFTPAGLEHLKHLKKLKKVDFGLTWVGRAGNLYGSEIARQLAAMPQLESIEGAGNFLPEDIKALGTLPHLRCLRMYLKDRRHGYVSPIGLGHLAGLDSLEELRILTMDTLSEADLMGVEQLRNLKHLGISSHGVTEGGVALIGKLRSLEHLDIHPITRSALNHLNGLSNLRSLNVNGFWGLDRNLAQADEGTLDLSGLTRLRNLTLQLLPLKDDDLAFLDHTPSVENLMIESATPLTGTSLRRFGELSELERLWIKGLSRCTSEDMAALNALARLRDLTLHGEISDATLGALDGLPHLWSVNVYTPEPIQPQTVVDLEDQLRGLEFIHIYAPPSASEPAAVRQEGRPLRNNADRRNRKRPRTRRRR
jgi:Leucine-rich repeat (LRR) protein